MTCRIRFQALVLLSMAGLGCGNDAPMAGPGPEGPQVLPVVLTSALVSNPVGLAAVTAPEVAYVSLPPGTFPDGETATIRNRATGAQATAVMANGGWDPVPIPAKAGDTLFIAIAAKGGSSSDFMYVVSRARRPVVVRTNPPPGKRDVPLNATLLVVFSEPIDPATITPQSVRLVLDGQPVAGRAELSSDGLRVEFRPDLELASITAYVLSVSADVTDLSGDPLERSVEVSFATEGELPPGTGSRIAAGYLMTCALNEAGRAYCWGQNRALGIGPGEVEPCIDTFTDGPSHPIETLCATRPVPVHGGLVFQSITAGGEHTCGLTTGGRAYCWGGNTRGQLGTGNTGFADTPVPVQGELVFRTLAAGLAFTCGLTTTGQAYCWGTDALAGFGASNQAFHVIPQLVLGGRVFASLDAGTNHACGLTSEGTAYCWGFNSEGQLGIGNTPLQPCYVTEVCARVPLPVAGDFRWTAVAGGWLRTCGLATDQSVYCWGRPHWQDPRGPSSVPVSIGTGTPAFSSLAEGWQGSSCGIAPNGEVWCWGLQINESSYKEVPVRVAQGISFTELTIGEGHMCGFTTGKELYCWGYNESGQLGVGTLEFHYSTPQLVRLP
jgi:alpha-tubulin suppressor-like RCC1 family protein